MIGKRCAVVLLVIGLLAATSACRAVGRAARAIDEVVEAGAGRALVRVAASAAGRVERSLDIRNRYVDAINQHLSTLERATSARNAASVADEAREFSSGLKRLEIPEEIKVDTEALIRALELLADAADAIRSRPTEDASQSEIDGYNRSVDAYNKAFSEFDAAFERIRARYGGSSRSSDAAERRRIEEQNRRIEVWNKYVGIVNEHLEVLNRALTGRDPLLVRREAQNFVRALESTQIPEGLATDHAAFVDSLSKLARAAQQISVRPDPSTATQREVDNYNLGVAAYNRALRELDISFEALRRHNP